HARCFRSGRRSLALDLLVALRLDLGVLAHARELDALRFLELARIELRSDQAPQHPEHGRREHGGHEDGNRHSQGIHGSVSVPVYPPPAFGLAAIDTSVMPADRTSSMTLATTPEVDA